jgi:predicted transcriptional regulator
MRYRSRTEIISQILEIANTESGEGVIRITKTKIMYEAFLSYAQLKEYLMILTGNDLLDYDLDTKSFKTTDKGRRFLETYNQIDELVKTQI